MSCPLALRCFAHQSHAIFFAARGRKLSRRGPFAEGQRYAGARSADIASCATPNSFDRHTAVSGIHQIQHAGLRIMPKRHAKRNTGRSLTQVLGIPVGQRSRADHGLPGLVGQRQLNRISPIGTLNDTGIRNINLALRPRWQNQCRLREHDKHYPRENCPRKVCEIQLTET